MFDVVGDVFEGVCSVIMVLIIVAGIIMGAGMFRIVDGGAGILIGIILGAVCGFVIDVVTFGFFAQIVRIKHLLEDLNSKMDKDKNKIGSSAPRLGVIANNEGEITARSLL